MSSAEPLTQAMARDRPRTMPGLAHRVFVYNDSTSSYKCSGSRISKTRFELKLPEFFRQGLLSTNDPAQADCFYHPACLCDIYWSTRYRGKLTGQARVSELAQNTERQILLEISKLGYAHKPHIVNSVRCAGGGGYHAHLMATFPVLWGSGQFLKFCSEAMAAVVTTLSAHIPYCPPESTPQLPFKPDRKDTVLFVGSDLTANPKRRKALDALVHTPGSRHVRLSNRSEIDTQQDGEALLDLMRDAVFTLCPAGDAPDSPRIYQAIARGSIPLVDSSFQRPSLAAWESFSWLIGVANQTHARPQEKRKRSLLLPSSAATRALQEAVWVHSHAFDCEPENPHFYGYLLRALNAFSTVVVPNASAWRSYARGGPAPT